MVKIFREAVVSAGDRLAQAMTCQRCLLNIRFQFRKGLFTNLIGLCGHTFRSAVFLLGIGGFCGRQSDHGIGIHFAGLHRHCQQHGIISNDRSFLFFRSKGRNHTAQAVFNIIGTHNDAEAAGDHRKHQRRRHQMLPEVNSDLPVAEGHNHNHQNCRRHKGTQINRPGVGHQHTEKAQAGDHRIVPAALAGLLYIKVNGKGTSGEHVVGALEEEARYLLFHNGRQVDDPLIGIHIPKLHDQRIIKFVQTGSDQRDHCQHCACIKHGLHEFVDPFLGSQHRHNRRNGHKIAEALQISCQHAGIVTGHDASCTLHCQANRKDHKDPKYLFLKQFLHIPDHHRRTDGHHQGQHDHAKTDGTYSQGSARTKDAAICHQNAQKGHDNFFTIFDPAFVVQFIHRRLPCHIFLSSK